MHTILDTKTDQTKTMLAFPVINARLDREGIRVEVVRCQTFRLSCSEGMFKAWWPWSPGGQPAADFLLLCFLWFSQEQRGRFSHSFPHLLFLQLDPFPPPPGSLRDYPDGSWPLALQTWQSTHLAFASSVA